MKSEVVPKGKKRKQAIFISIVMLMVMLMSSLTFADVLFSPNVNYGAGPYPMSIVTADFNGDGKVDLATVGLRNVSVLLGNGDGTFQAKRDIVTGGRLSSSWSIAVGDFNNDGKFDLATVNNTYNVTTYYDEITMSVVLGNGDGTFQAPIIYVTRDFSWGDITTGDFNSDGNLDLVRANSLTSGVTVYMGNGDGTFREGKGYETGPLRVYKIITADVNNDGMFDIITANYGTGSNQGSVSILLGNGDGTFQESSVLEASGWVFSVIAGDFDGDGHVDLATIIHDNIVSVFMGKGDGSFQTKQDYITGGTAWRGARAIGAADFNGDGKPDLATATFGAISVLIGNGDGTFQPRKDFSWPLYKVSAYVSLVTGDFNMDGKIDLASVANENHVASIFLNTTPNRPPIAKAGQDKVIECAGPSGASVTTLDGSGSYDPDGNVLTYSWTWAGGTAEGVNPKVELPLGTTAVALTVSDGKLSASDVVNIKILDTTPPVTATESNDEWSKTNVILTISSSDSCSGVKLINYTINDFETKFLGSFASTEISAEGTNSIAYYAVDNVGNVEHLQGVTIKIDKTPPIIAATPSGINGNGGWYVSSADVSFVAIDGLSGVREIHLSLDSGAEYIVTGEEAGLNNIGEGRHAITYYAVDKAGNVGAPQLLAINVDTTPPAFVIKGVQNGAQYPLGLVPTASYTVSDALSGIAASSDTLTGGDGLGLGIYTYRVDASDVGGNTATVSVSFEVLATQDGLIALIRQMLASNKIDNAGIADSLIVKVQNAQKANGNAADNIMQAFINQVEAQSGKHIASDAAAILIHAAEYIISH